MGAWRRQVVAKMEDLGVTLPLQELEKVGSWGGDMVTPCSRWLLKPMSSANRSANSSAIFVFFALRHYGW